MTAGGPEVFDAVHAVALALHRQLADVAATHGLTPQQAIVLRRLHEPVPMGAIADELACDPSNVTGLIDRIERLGLVERVPAPGDRRVKLLALTAAGKRTKRSIDSTLDVAAVLGGLSPSELDDLSRLVTKAAAALAESEAS